MCFAGDVASIAFALEGGWLCFVYGLGCLHCLLMLECFVCGGLLLGLYWFSACVLLLFYGAPCSFGCLRYVVAVFCVLLLVVCWVLALIVL